MRLLTAKEAAAVLRVKPPQVYDLLRRGSLPAVRIGRRRLRVDEAKLREFIERGGCAEACPAR